MAGVSFNRPVKYRLHVVGGRPAINKAIVDALDKHFGKRMLIIQRELEDRIKHVVNLAFVNSEEYRSMMGQGVRTLRGHFGLRHPDAKVGNLVRHWVDNIEVVGKKRKSTSKSLGLSFRVFLIDSTFQDVLTQEFAYQETGTKQLSLFGTPVTVQDRLPWLRWLLLEGNKTIIADYGILFKPGAGRSGEAIMIQGKNKRRWKVPSTHSGTQRDNWATRTIASVQDDIAKIIEETIRKRLD